MATDKQLNALSIELGKRQGQIILDYESLPKIHGWVARDKDGHVAIYSYSSKPKRALGDDQFWEGNDSIPLPRLSYPEITWESEPVEVELLIRKV